MKKFSYFMIACTTALTLTACSGGETPSETAEDAKWPTSPVTLTVTASSGGGTDIVARTLLENISEYGTFAVDNNTDGNGVVAFEDVQKEDPENIDQLVFFNTGFFTNYAVGLTDINPVEDLTPVFAMDQDGVYYVVVPKDSPFNSINDVVDYCKAHPGELNFGVNPGDAVHVFAGSMQKILDVDWNWVATGTDGDRVKLIMGNNLDITVLNQSTTWNYYEGDEIKVLCSLQGRSELADPKLSAVPTLEEAGYQNVPIKMTIVVWAPNGAPETVYKQMNEIFAAGAGSEGFIDSYKARGNLYYSIGDFETTKAEMKKSLEYMIQVCKDLDMAAPGR